ncbi:MAG: LamG-like jellyroll fold domain-containing protein [Candidatus Loosdrechtia sp.]|uniref:LamG domain-containing protein n=1 Tax=Candidatus Loosdrechtia sp. TaxID=3101272 RepID=UPI003A7431B9|nr:MAG: LamG domain-containing protein [Candidatus Jettenia sp. AMX2]
MEGFSGNTDLDTNWHFVVVVNDMANNERRIYVDGQLDGTSTAFPYGNQGSQGHLRIGQDTCNDERFNGWVDEIAIFNRTLSEGEIQQMYKNGLAGKGYCEVVPGLTCVYQEDTDEEHPDHDHPLLGFYYYVTYNKPSGAIAAKWRVKHGDYDPYEIVIPQACWDADPTKLMLRLYSNSNDGMGQSVSWPECYDGSNWVAVGKVAIDVFGGSGIDSGPIYMTDGDWNTYNVWNEVGPVASTWQTNYSQIAPRWYEEAILWLVEKTPAGFVTGGGWINSPEGAYTANPTLTGKANFGFVSRYKKGTKIPQGQTEFQFKAAGLNFRSDTYEWLLISGTLAQYKGTGTINGAGNYGFKLTAFDGNLVDGREKDKFRIKIWDKATGEIVYDNQTGDADNADLMTEIGKGPIVIHEKK